MLMRYAIRTARTGPTSSTDLSAFLPTRFRSPSVRQSPDSTWLVSPRGRPVVVSRHRPHAGGTSTTSLRRIRARFRRSGSWTHRLSSGCRRIRCGGSTSPAWSGKSLSRAMAEAAAGLATDTPLLPAILPPSHLARGRRPRQRQPIVSWVGRFTPRPSREKAPGQTTLPTGIVHPCTWLPGVRGSRQVARMGRPRSLRAGHGAALFFPKCAPGQAPSVASLASFPSMTLRDRKP